MPANRNYTEPHSARFINFSCLRHLPILEPNWAKDIVVDSLALAKDRLGFNLYAFAVMPDHVHLLLRPNDEIAAVSRILGAKKLILPKEFCSDFGPKVASFQRVRSML